jgi:hypothetical protein
MSIGGIAFGGTSLNSISIPDSVKTFGLAFAFGHEGGCLLLTSVTIGAGVTEIHSKAFNISPLREIRVDPRNTRYAARDGVLYSKDFTVLVLFPRGRKITEYVIPAGVTTIGDDAFRACPLNSVTIPDSVTSIGDHAFFRNQLTSVTIGAGVTLSAEDPGLTDWENVGPSFDDGLVEYYNANGKKAGTYTRRRASWSYSAR